MSANFSITADIADSGGRLSSSSRYTNDGSTGAVGGISTSSAVTAKAGYPAQLYDVIGFAITAHAPGMNETGSLQLEPVHVLDDSTHLAIPPASVVWSVESGPITLTSDGVALADIVYQDTPATARGTLGALTDLFEMTVYNGLPDNYLEYASDSLDDDWQVLHFGLPPNADSGPLGDPDGDGQNNRFEFIAGVDPLDAASVFKLRIEKAPVPSNDMKLIFGPRLDDRIYRVWFRPNLVTPPLWDILGGATQIDVGDERVVTDPNALGTKFYRIEVTKP